MGENSHNSTKQIPADQSGTSAINWIKVESTNVKKIYYNFHKQDLYVMFKDNSTYVYFNVEKNVFMEFLTAPSKGAFVRQELKPYQYKKI